MNETQLFFNVIFLSKVLSRAGFGRKLMLAGIISSFLMLAGRSFSYSHILIVFMFYFQSHTTEHCFIFVNALTFINLPFKMTFS